MIQNIYRSISNAKSFIHILEITRGKPRTHRICIFCKNFLCCKQRCRICRKKIKISATGEIFRRVFGSLVVPKNFGSCNNSSKNFSKRNTFSKISPESENFPERAFPHTGRFSTSGISIVSKFKSGLRFGFASSDYLLGKFYEKY